MMQKRCALNLDMKMCFKKSVLVIIFGYDDLFVTCWTLILVDKIFAPTTSLSVSKRLLETCLDVNIIMSYDWVGYIMEAVRKSAKKLQEDRSATFANGSTYFLGVSIMYLPIKYILYFLFVLLPFTSAVYRVVFNYFP
jgi:hypothetical protein